MSNSFIAFMAVLMLFGVGAVIFTIRHFNSDKFVRPVNKPTYTPERPPNILMILLTILVLIASAWMSFTAITDAVDRRSLIKNGVVTTGRVLWTDKDAANPGQDDVTTYTVAYTFTPQGSEPIETQSYVTKAKFKKTNKGQDIKIRYDSKDISNSTADLKAHSTMDTFLPLILALPWLLGSILILFRWKRRFF